MAEAKALGFPWGDLGDRTTEGALVKSEVITFRMLRAHQQEALREWRRNIRTGEGSVGLWVYGDRRAGTTTIGRVAVARMEWDDFDSEEVTCLRLSDAIKMTWRAGEISRHLPNDYDLYVESNLFDMQVERYWDVDVLFVDDFHAEQIDMAFWRRFVQVHIEERLKDRKPTIIAADMEPKSPTLGRLAPIIEDMFVTCYAER